MNHTLWCTVRYNYDDIRIQLTLSVNNINLSYQRVSMQETYIQLKSNPLYYRAVSKTICYILSKRRCFVYRSTISLSLLLYQFLTTMICNIMYVCIHFFLRCTYLFLFMYLFFFLFILDIIPSHIFIFIGYHFTLHLSSPMFSL